MQRWKPNVTVATVVERDGCFLLVKEHTSQGIRYNQPAGHLEHGETLLDAARRETLEESGWQVEPYALIGIYQTEARHDDMTYLRFAFACRAIEYHRDRPLDQGIISADWFTAQQIGELSAEHRSPAVARCLYDYLQGQRHPLALIQHLL